MLVSKIALKGLENEAPERHLFDALVNHSVVETKIPGADGLFKVWVGINFNKLARTETITGNSLPENPAEQLGYPAREHARVTEILNDMGFSGISASRDMKVLLKSQEDLDFEAAEELIDSVRELVEMVPNG